MKEFEYLKGAFRLDCHVHTNDVSMCARASVWEWRDFYQKNLPWVEGIVITNHSHPPGLYDSRVMSRKIELNSYNQVRELKVISGVEVNILKGGKLDVDSEVLERIPWVAAALNPLPIENGDGEEIKADTRQIEEVYVKVARSGLVDVMAHPTKDISEGKLKKISWPNVFSECKNAGVMVEICLLGMAPDWWIELVVKSGCVVTVGSDWHGMYHFRQYKPVGRQADEALVWEKVRLGGRDGFDQLSRPEKAEYNSLYSKGKMPDEFYSSFKSLFQKLKKLGLEERMIFSHYGAKLLESYVATSRDLRPKFLRNYVN